MPTTTCPVCHRYVQVQDVRDAAPFACPYCPPSAPALVQYKCTSCMKVSLLNPVTCPKCFTMIRPGARALLTPVLPPPPSNPADWTYHTTNLRVAHSIKRIGLQSILTLTGQQIAPAHGAFARNRDMRLQLPPQDPANPVVQQLKRGIAYLRCLGLDQLGIGALAQAPPPIAFVPTGRDEDRENLDKARDSVLAEIARSAGIRALPAKVEGARNFFRVYRADEVGAQAAALALQPGNSLTVWASAYVTLYYRIEEVKTTSRVYFLKARHARDGYVEYTKNVSKAVIVVLRVRKANIIGLVDDISEFKAECTPHGVLPHLIEIMVGFNPDRFTDDAYRNDDRNWINITQWNA